VITSAGHEDAVPTSESRLSQSSRRKIRSGVTKVTLPRAESFTDNFLRRAWSKGAGLGSLHQQTIQHDREVPAPEIGSELIRETPEGADHHLHDREVRLDNVESKVAVALCALNQRRQGRSDTCLLYTSRCV